MSPSAVVRTVFNAYRVNDLDTAAPLIAEDFVFTSPQDDHINKTEYFARCFPTAERFSSQTILQLIDTGHGGVFLLYEYELTTGERYRNAEFVTVRDGQLIETEVFFGGRVG